jgi:hypothetical protein
MYYKLTQVMTHLSSRVSDLSRSPLLLNSPFACCPQREVSRDIQSPACPRLHLTQVRTVESFSQAHLPHAEGVLGKDSDGLFEGRSYVRRTCSPDELGVWTFNTFRILKDFGIRWVGTWRYIKCLDFCRGLLGYTTMQTGTGELNVIF